MFFVVNGVVNRGEPTDCMISQVLTDYSSAIQLFAEARGVKSTMPHFHKKIIF